MRNVCVNEQGLQQSRLGNGIQKTSKEKESEQVSDQASESFSGWFRVTAQSWRATVSHFMFSVSAIGVAVSGEFEFEWTALFPFVHVDICLQPT